jgi:MFS family permease
MALSALATAMLPAHPPALLVMVVLFIFGGSALGWNGVYLAEVARQAPAGMAGVATGGTLAITFFGVMLGPPLFGGLAGVFGSYRVGFAALAVPLCVCAAVLWRTPPAVAASSP